MEVILNTPISLFLWVSSFQEVQKQYERAEVAEVIVLDSWYRRHADGDVCVSS